MKSGFWVLCGIALLCFESGRCSRNFLDNDENFLDKTRHEGRTLKEEDTEWELYKARNSWNDLTNELSELYRMQKTPSDENDFENEKKLETNFNKKKTGDDKDNKGGNGGGGKDNKDGEGGEDNGIGGEEDKDEISDTECEETYPQCTVTGGKCSKDDNDAVMCNCKAGITYDKTTFCNVPVAMCNEKNPKCTETGGTCSVDTDGTSIKCNCKAGITYDAATACNVPVTMCNEKNPKCTETGGTCSVETDGTSIKCNCKAGITYDTATACNVTVAVCNEKNPKCTETGGTCSLDAGGMSIKCNCKAGITYDAATACNVTVGMCKEKQPGCIETKGSCKVVSNSVKCDCEKDFLYKDNSGCAEDKCIAKCGIAYNKPNDKLICVGGPFGDVNCKCKNTTLAFDSKDKTCKINYCKVNCGNDNRIKCDGDIFDEDFKCECNDKNYEFVEEDNKKSCKLNYCKKVCGHDERITCDGDRFKDKKKSDCKCDDSDYAYNGEKCQEKCYDDCENGGNCEGDEGNKLCVCPKTTSGDKCDVIIDCQPGKIFGHCTGDKGKCVLKEGKAGCDCSELEGKELYTKLGYCEVKCDQDKDCGDNKKCNSDKFCECKPGYEGDDCTTITGCEQLQKKCDEIKTKCIFDENALGKGTCECEAGLKYDRTGNKCRLPCKDNKCEGNRKCNDDKYCVCKDGYEGDDCTTVTGCKDLEAKCAALEVSCIFDETSPGKPTCNCTEGFKYDKKENKCKHSFCYPNDPCPQNANCTVEGSIGFCLCPEDQYYNYKTGKCENFLDKCLLRKKSCNENEECVKNTGQCKCKYSQKEEKGVKEECKAKLCEKTACFTRGKCSENDGSCYCEETKYYYDKACKDAKCKWNEFKTNCSCPQNTQREDGKECLHKTDDEKCENNTFCGYGVCVKRNIKDTCSCFHFARKNVNGTCILSAGICPGNNLQEGSMKCKCEGQYTQADDGITCRLKTCADKGVKEECESKGGECKMNWKGIGYYCACPVGYEKDANEKCTDRCSIEKYMRTCADKGQFCYNSYSTSNTMTSTCECPPTVKKGNDGKCGETAENTYLIKNIPVMKTLYKLESGINKMLLNAHLIASLRETFRTNLFDFGYLYDYKVQDDVVQCSVWINFKSAPGKPELEKLKIVPKKFSKVCDDCDDDALVWPPNLLLGSEGMKEVVAEKLEFCKDEVKDRLCGKGASCDKKTNKCFCNEGYKLIEYSIRKVGPYEVQRCEDIDECAEGTHKCPGKTKCRNTFGNYSCVCQDGFQKNKKDIDPETDKSDCVDMCTPNPCNKGKCKVKGLSFDCECPPGKAGSFCGRDDEPYLSAKKSTVVVGAVLGTILAVGAVAVLYYIIKRRGGICEE